MIKLFDLKINYNCNADCIHCFISDRRKALEPSFEEIKESILRLDGVQSVVVSGGEPTIRDDFLEILKYIKKLGHRTIVQTNGIRFADTDFTKRSAEYIDYVMYTFHSYRKEIHEKILNSNIKDVYDLSIKGMLNLKNFGVHFGTQTVISKYNYDHIKETFDFIQNINSDAVMHLSYPDIVGNAKSFGSYVSYSDAFQYIQTALKAWDDKTITAYIPNCITYPYNENTPFLFPGEFDVNSKLFLHHGYDRSIEDDIVKDYYIENYVRNIVATSLKSDKCNKCIYNNSCSGIRDEYYNTFKKIDVKPIEKITHEVKDDYDHPNIQGFNLDTHSKTSNEDFNSILNQIDNKKSAIFYINNINKNYLQKTFELCKELGVKKFIVANSFTLDNADLKSVLLDFFYKNFHMGSKEIIRFHDTPHCLFGECGFFIKNNMNKNKEKKSHSDECADCIYKYKCDGIVNDKEFISAIHRLENSNITYLTELEEQYGRTQ